MTIAHILMICTVENLEMRFPPKVLIVQRIVFVEQHHIIGQLFRIFKCSRVDKRMPWSDFLVIAVQAENDGNHRMMQCVEKLLSDVVSAQSVLQCHVKLVVFGSQSSTIKFIGL